MSGSEAQLEHGRRRLRWPSGRGPALRMQVAGSTRRQKAKIKNKCRGTEKRGIGRALTHPPLILSLMFYVPRPAYAPPYYPYLLRAIPTVRSRSSTSV